MTRSALNNSQPVIHGNELYGNTTEDLYAYNYFDAASITLDATGNWWGAASGPSGNGTGTGDAVSLDVAFAPFLTTAPAGCENDNALTSVPAVLEGTRARSADEFAPEAAETVLVEEIRGERRDRKAIEQAERDERDAAAFEASYDG